MSMRFSSFLVFAGIVALGSDALAQRSDLLPVQRRAASVDLAARIVAPRVPSALPTPLKNPFVPDGFDLPDAGETGAVAPTQSNVRPPQVRTSRDTLEIIVANIQPTGTISRRGEPILLFGSKQVRVGEDLTVTYEGDTYVLVVTAIQSTSFTVRLNNDEITRPIKPGTKP
ncbi:hypothetical protein MASR2M8_16850 [Opitutaceae bacterium]